MSLIAAATLATAQAVLPSCNWHEPGHNRFRGDVAAAVRHYADLPAPVVARLQQRIRAFDYDDMVEIRRDAIVGRHTYAPELRDMHFGRGLICREVNRARWQPSHVERGMVYCEDGHCVVVPTVCNNLSRITRLGPAVLAGGGAGVPGVPDGLASAPGTRGVPDADGTRPAPDSAAHPTAEADAPETPDLTAGPLNPGSGPLPEPAPPAEGPSFEDLVRGGTPGGGVTDPGLPGGPVANAPTPGPTPGDGSIWGPAPETGPGWGAFDPIVFDRDPFPSLILGVPGTPAIPEPGTAPLALLGLAAVVAAWRRRASARH